MTSQNVCCEKVYLTIESQQENVKRKTKEMHLKINLAPFSFLIMAVGIITISPGRDKDKTLTKKLWEPLV